MDHFDNIFDDTLLNCVILDLRPIIREYINIIEELNTPDIKIEKVQTAVSGDYDLIIKGKDVCHGLVNAICRTIMENYNINPYYILITSTEFRLCFEGGFKEACLVLSKKLECLEKNVKDAYENDPEYQKNHILIRLDIQEYGIYHLLSNILGKSEYLMIAVSYESDSLTEHTFKLKIRDNSNFLPIKILIDSIKWGKKMFNVILKQWK